MNKFKKLGSKGGLTVHSGLLSVVLHGSVLMSNQP
jgi:hypothetical protein